MLRIRRHGLGETKIYVEITYLRKNYYILETMYNIMYDFTMGSRVPTYIMTYCDDMEGTLSYQHILREQYHIHDQKLLIPRN